MLLRATLALTLLCPIAGHAADVPKLPQGVTCSDIRERVAEHGRAAAIAWALASGYSWRQIRLAQQCLR